jgi:hypothetical protein
MAPPSKPTILIVDDEPDLQRPLLLLLRESAEARSVHPDEITEDQLVVSDLVLVDFVLQNWPARENTSSIGLKPLDGRALAAVLRGHIERRRTAPPSAFALYTAHLRDLSGGFPPAFQEHIIARGNNLEWAFSKVSGDSAFPLHKQIMSLASAVRVLPEVWPSDEIDQTKRQVDGLLGLDAESPWTVRAWEDIEACHPPLHEMSERSHGLAFVRWLLHRILPYPCFLYDAQYLAARLRVTPASLRRAFQQHEPLHDALSSSSYRGILSDFLGTRWWRAGVETYLWEATKGDPFDLRKLHTVIGATAGSALTPTFAEPVVCIDENLRELDDLWPSEGAVRIQPDDWPPFADQAWTPQLRAAESPRLRALVIEQDRNRIGQENQNAPKAQDK